MKATEIKRNLRRMGYSPLACQCRHRQNNPFPRVLLSAAEADRLVATGYAAQKPYRDKSEACRDGSMWVHVLHNAMKFGRDSAAAGCP